MISGKCTYTPKGNCRGLLASLPPGLPDATPTRPSASAQKSACPEILNLLVLCMSTSAMQLQDMSSLITSSRSFVGFKLCTTLSTLLLFYSCLFRICQVKGSRKGVIIIIITSNPDRTCRAYVEVPAKFKPTISRSSDTP